MISIIIPLFNQLPFTRLCLEYLERYTSLDLFELILVDNASTDGTEDFLATIKLPAKVIRNASNLGFSKACNQGASEAKGELLLFLNNDTVPHRGWLPALAEPFEDPEVGITGAKLVYPDGTIQHAGVVFARSKLPYHLYAACDADAPYVNRQRRLRAVTGACLLIRGDLFREMGGFDERYCNGLEDVDLCLKVARAGWKILYQPSSVLTHFESRSENRQAAMMANRDLFWSIWKDTIIQDDSTEIGPDGMDIWVTDNGDISFLSRDEAEAKLATYRVMAHNLVEQGQLQDAMICCRGMLHFCPYNENVFKLMASIFLKLGDAASSEKCLAVATDLILTSRRKTALSSGILVD